MVETCFSSSFGAPMYRVCVNVVADVMWKISFHAMDFPFLSYSPFISMSLLREVTSNGVQPWSLKSAHQIPRTFVVLPSRQNAAYSVNSSPLAVVARHSSVSGLPPLPPCQT